MSVAWGVVRYEATAMMRLFFPVLLGCLVLSQAQRAVLFEVRFHGSCIP